MEKIGLVTVLYNSDNVLEGFFKSLSEQTYSNYILYMVDNSPSAKSDAVIKDLLEKFPIENIFHLRSEDNIGVAAGNNVGIKAALKDKCDKILLLNNDIEFSQKELLENMLDQMNAKNEKIVIPKILYYDSRKIWMAGGIYSKYSVLTHHVGDGKDPNENEYNTEKYFNYAPTCFMMISPEVFEKAGIMDEEYFVYYDDTDFIFKAMKQGFKILYLPQFEILHKVSSSTGGGDSPFSIFYGNRNRLYFIRKNLTGLQNKTALLYYLMTRLPTMMKYNKKKNESLLKGLKNGLFDPIRKNHG